MKKEPRPDLLAAQIEKEHEELVLLQSRLRDAIRKKEIQDAQRLRLSSPPPEGPGDVDAANDRVQ